MNWKSFYSDLGTHSVKLYLIGWGFGDVLIWLVMGFCLLSSTQSFLISVKEQVAMAHLWHALVTTMALWRSATCILVLRASTPTCIWLPLLWPPLDPQRWFPSRYAASHCDLVLWPSPFPPYFLHSLVLAWPPQQYPWIQSLWLL